MDGAVAAREGSKWMAVDQPGRSRESRSVRDCHWASTEGSSYPGSVQYESRRSSNLALVGLALGRLACMRLVRLRSPIMHIPGAESCWTPDATSRRSRAECRRADAKAVRATVLGGGLCRRCKDQVLRSRRTAGTATITTSRPFQVPAHCPLTQPRSCHCG